MVAGHDDGGPKGAVGVSSTHGEQRDEDPLVGRVLVDRYQIDRKLGEGGMGSVYSARHTTLDKEVALKVLHGEYSRKEDLVERFLQEAKAASKIRHENVIDITDFGKTPDGYVFFAMELLEGRDLHEELARAKLDDRTLPWKRTRKIFLQVSAALEAVHGQGIVHRDLKPENIYLVEWYGHQDFVKLLDFGIAKNVEVNEDGRKLTKTGMLFGTPEYMSPEQARGEQADHRSDIYAMGCILFQMLTGNVPFDGENFMAVLTKHLADEVPEMGAALRQSDAPAALEAVIHRALTKKPAERFQSIKDFAEAVRLVHEDAVPVATERAPTGGRKRTQWTGSVKSLGELEGEADTREGLRKRRGSTLVVSGALVAAIVAGGAFLLTCSGTPASTPQPSPVAALSQESPTTQAKAPVQETVDVAVVLVTEPPGASVSNTDGRIIGTTPHEIKAPSGSEAMTLQLRLRGYETRSVEVSFAKSGPLIVPLVKSKSRRKPEVTSATDDDEGAATTTVATPEPEPGVTPTEPTPPEKKPPEALKCDPKVNKDCERLKTEFPDG